VGRQRNASQKKKTRKSSRPAEKKGMKSKPSTQKDERHRRGRIGLIIESHQRGGKKLIERNGGKIQGRPKWGAPVFLGVVE